MANKPRFTFLISVVVLFSALVGLGSLVQAQLLNQDDILSWLGEKAEQIFDDKVDKFINNKWNNKQDNVGDNWVKVLTHEAFPDYEIKLKEPKICDPTVKQVGIFIANEKKKLSF